VRVPVCYTLGLGSQNTISFPLASVIVNGVAQRDSNDPAKLDSMITQSATSPTVIPFALGHYRIGEVSVGGDRRWAFSSAAAWESALLGLDRVSRGHYDLLPVLYALSACALRARHASDERTIPGRAPRQHCPRTLNGEILGNETRLWIHDPPPNLKKEYLPTLGIE
jgi:hypothetical protein